MSPKDLWHVEHWASSANRMTCVCMTIFVHVLLKRLQATGNTTEQNVSHPRSICWVENYSFSKLPTVTPTPTIKRAHAPSLRLSPLIFGNLAISTGPPPGSSPRRAACGNPHLWPSLKNRGEPPQHWRRASPFVSCPTPPFLPSAEHVDRDLSYSGL